jgi:hypothetical protein
MSREFAEPGVLAGVVRVAYGPRRRLTRLTRLRGGSKKGVYRLLFDDGETAILYVWSPVENYWPDGGDDQDPAEPFAAASGFGHFGASHARLSALGVPVPQVHLLDSSQQLYPADLALVEDVRGGTLEDLLRRAPQRAEPVMNSLNAALRTMHGHRSEGIGKLASVEVKRPGRGQACVDIVLDRAVADLDSAAAQIGRVAAVRDRLADVTHALAAQIRPRTEHRLIHGELGPDHVLIRDNGQPVLIDIEGIMFFDVEWEHAFLALRFGDSYRWLRIAGLDDARLRFYTLALHLSLIAGPLRLLAGDYPDREPFLRIIEHNTTRALSFLPGSGQP